jgi:GNAT superfamily N-acetyltransferase
MGMKRTKPSTIRLGEADRASLAAHFACLGEEDRRLRFGLNLGDESLRDYVARIDFSRDRLYGVHDDSLKLVAVVHVAAGEGGSELGLSVVPGWRGQGLGDALFRRAVNFLRNRNARVVFVHCLAENAAMLHLARKNGMRTVFSHGEGDARLELEPPTASTFIAEWTEDHQGRVVRALRQNLLSTQRVLALFGR